MKKSYKIRCKICNDILEAEIPLNGEIRCSCGNVGIYSDYIAYNYNHLDLSRDECYEDLNKNKLKINEAQEYYNKIENDSKIISNKIQCVRCKDIIESKYPHDFRKCCCGKVAVDGGHEYLKRVGNENLDYIELSELKKD